MNRTAEHARHAAESAQQWVGSVGDSLRRSDAAKWLEAGLKIGALRTGARVIGGFARRHPAVAIATVAGAGLLCYASYRHRQRLRAAASNTADEAGDRPLLEGRAQRVEARRGGAGADAAQPAVTPAAE
ncbi:hypothetical protein [Marilutibacter chinensis]|uniref:DUF3618 domain-containing protein n=1 Tax=Marilutibacter chinensis TaxID=2912247 RepID=A0ABS9HZT9_9GAMM|nr:hypothetical protein [Lysobacter chinensis]MCF7223582.1 hypothetical protein [Lysobacter chinensis]